MPDEEQQGGSASDLDDAFFDNYHEPVDERGLTLRERLALEIIDADGRIPPEHRLTMARWWRHLPDQLYADTIDLTDVLHVGRTGVVHSIRQARSLLGPRLGKEFMDPIIVRYTEQDRPRTRLYARPDAMLWQRVRPMQTGRWPHSARRRPKGK